MGPKLSKFACNAIDDFENNDWKFSMAAQITIYEYFK